MHTTAPAITTTEPSAPVSEAFENLHAARAELRRADDDCQAHRRALRRYAYTHRLGLKAARGHLRTHQEADWLALNQAELAAWRALRDFRRVALIAALERVIDTDRRIKAGQPLAA